MFSVFDSQAISYGSPQLRWLMSLGEYLLVHQWQIVPVHGFRAWKWTLSFFQRFSTGLRSGLWEDRCHTLILVSSKSLWTNQDACFCPVGSRKGASSETTVFADIRGVSSTFNSSYSATVQRTAILDSVKLENTSTALTWASTIFRVPDIF